jgi:ribonuclease J
MISRDSPNRNAHDAVLISHPHQDHYGLLEDVPSEWPVHAGEATTRLIRITSGIFGKPLTNNFISWKSGVPFAVGPFTITPFLTDHSAFDAHMLLIEVHGKRIL